MRKRIVQIVCAAVVGMGLATYGEAAYSSYGDMSIDGAVKQMTAVLLPQIEMSCKRNCDIFSDSENRRKRCKELDELGGQPLITQDIISRSQQWVTDNMGYESRFYLKKVPKTNLLIDRQKKNRQDNVMKVVSALRENVFYAYCQSASLGLKERRFQEMSAEYKKLMQMGYWRDIGDRQNAKAVNAAQELCRQIEHIHLLCIEAFDDIIAVKQNYYAAFLKAHPDSARTAQALQRARKAEARATAAENAAWSAQLSAWAANSRAAEAEGRAMEAEASANAANQKAQEAERKAQFGF